MSWIMRVNETPVGRYESFPETVSAFRALPAEDQKTADFELDMADFPGLEPRWIRFVDLPVGMGTKSVRDRR